MEHYPDQQAYDGMELLDWLFDQNDGILRNEEEGHCDNQHHRWPDQEPNMLQLAEQADADFIHALLSGGESASDSPLWSPAPSDSGISEDPPSDQMDSPQRPESPPCDFHCPLRAQGKAALEAQVPMKPNVWKVELPADRTRFPQYSSDVNRAPLCSGSSLTVKDLLLSGTAEPPPQPFLQSVQELILNEDEKKLLAKEGVTLPSQLPLTKYEERILKKIRRKIRNKQSAQESRKKKKEYIDGLESRMAACSAHNQELQRKVSQLEKCNISLIEQLRRLQVLVMNTSNKPAQTGTCVLVLLLSFSLILLPNLKPYADTKVSQGDYSPVRIQSRSLQDVEGSRMLHIIDPPLQTQDEPKPLHRHFPGDSGMQITTLMGNMKLNQELDAMSPNRSHGESLGGHFHVDPVTGHIATVTLDPKHSTRLPPNADDM
ncbi:cyclic AMP-responsive element-binding protein 3-like protein 3-A isoform X2 [Syngnathoides biaculeatus]|uniref:cyclic AMP-responsive element-binding protein 3-like protein 3-A isoform X2 n=1 Tax=Syngnathoides biaculeatus TaxID=300417 RepID=UPI002ADDF702|nr:cyclic AMP-responsive element-binding protein 3-like protein 3-A isoform X2 [Syngnathoides biaculeatus]